MWISYMKSSQSWSESLKRWLRVVTDGNQEVHWQKFTDMLNNMTLNQSLTQESQQLTFRPEFRLKLIQLDLVLMMMSLACCIAWIGTIAKKSRHKYTRFIAEITWCIRSDKTSLGKKRRWVNGERNTLPARVLILVPSSLRTTPKPTWSIRAPSGMKFAFFAAPKTSSKCPDWPKSVT